MSPLCLQIHPLPVDYFLYLAKFLKKRKLGWLITILHFFAEFTFKDKSQILRNLLTQLSVLPGLWDKLKRNYKNYSFSEDCGQMMVTKLWHM